MVIKCPICNHFVSDMAQTCPHCGAIMKKDVYSSQVSTFDEEQIQDSKIDEDNSEDNPQSNQFEQPEIRKKKFVQEKELTPSKNESSAPMYSAPVAPPPDFADYQEAKKSNSTLIAIISLLAVIICGAGGYFYYNNIYLPAKIDREAPRYYTSANVVVLRSSRSAGADFNKVASLPYGTELITYEHDSEWSRVKVNSQNGEKQEGYVASPYILNKTDFFLMNSIFGNQESKETIITNKCRLALLNYFKEKRYVGKIDEQMRIESGITITPSSENQWQVFTKPKDAKPNNVLFKRLYNKNSQFTDFAVIITNSVTNARKLLYFYFDDDETPHLLTEQDAPEQGYIVNATYEYDYYSGSKELSAYYSY